MATTIPTTDIRWMNNGEPLNKTIFNRPIEDLLSKVNTKITALTNETDAKASTALATTSSNGLMSAVDKSKLDSASSTQIGYLNTVTSNVQDQLNGKAAASHTHSISQVTNLQSSLDAKASTSHTHSEYALTSHTHSYAAVSHTHSASDINSGTLGSDRLPWANQYSRGAVRAYVSGTNGYIYTY